MACSNRADDSRKKADSGNSQRKGASKTRAVSASAARTSAAGARKSTKKSIAIPTPTTKRRKKNSDADPLFVDPPNDAYAPYFVEFEGKRAPNFTAMEDLVFCKSYAAVSKDPTVGTDQTAETIWGKIFESFDLLSAYERERTEHSTSVLHSPGRIDSQEQSSPR